MARNGECIIIGEFSGHVGNSVHSFEGVHGGYGWIHQN